MRRTFVVTSLLIFALLLSGCSTPTDETMANSSDETMATPILPPKEQFIKVLNENFTNYLDYWRTAPGVNDQALSKFITSINVESDEAFSTVTINANTEFGGDKADLTMGALIGAQLDSINGMRAVVYCAGKTYPNDEDDTFNEFVEWIAIGLNDYVASTYPTKLDFPTKGIVIKMSWSKATTTVDKYGSETKKLSPIGIDQVGISTENFTKITDVFSAKYRELSDIAPVKYAKKSWHDGLCAISQSRNN